MLWRTETACGRPRAPVGGGGLGLPGCGFMGKERGAHPRLGPWCPDSLAPDSSPSHPTGSQRFLSLEATNLAQPAGNGSERTWWLKLRGPPRAMSRWGRAAAPARGEARPRGPRAARQAARAAPSRPAFLAGLIPPPGAGGGCSGPAPSAFSACAPAQDPCPAVSAALSLRTLLRAPAESQHAEGPSTRAPQTPGGRAGCLGPGRTSSARRPR